MTPGIDLLTATRPHQLLHQSRQDRRGMFPADQVKQFKCLVAEVEQMAGIRVETVGDRAENYVGKLPRRSLHANRREHGSLRAVAMADHCPIMEPSLKRLEREVTGFQGVDFTARRLTGAVGSHASRPLV